MKQLILIIVTLLFLGCRQEGYGAKCVEADPISYCCLVDAKGKCVKESEYYGWDDLDEHPEK